MKNLQRVVWSQGMFLTPQQFQAQDNYFDEALHFRLTHTSFANWGVASLDIDTDTLANGFFSVRSSSGLLPDGLPFEFPNPDRPPAGRALQDFLRPTQRTLDVFLAIPERQPRGKNFDLAAGAGSAPVPTSGSRFIADTRYQPDECDPSEEKPVQFASKNLRLLLEGENLDGYTAMRIAQITRNEQGAYILNPEFIPPCLDIASSDVLMNLLKRQVEVLTSKRATVAARRRQSGEGLTDFSASEIEDYWLLNVINSRVPELMHIWSVRRGHPEPVFVSMLQLAGSLATFSTESDDRELPSYDHNNLGPCFLALDARIRNLLERVRPSRYVAVPLTTQDHLIWHGAVTEDQYFRDSQFYLAVTASAGVEDLIKRMLQSARISSPSDIHYLVANALPGLAIRHVPVPPTGIPVLKNNQYFAFNQSGEHWKKIVESRQVSVFVPTDIQDARMELMIALG